MPVNVVIERFDGKNTFEQRYAINEGEGRTVLGLLLEISLNQDPTLGFRFNCRFKHCGLCSVTINGRPYPACLHRARGNLRLAPLEGFPVLGDLVIDRAPYLNRLRTSDLYRNRPRGDARAIPDEKLHRAALSCTDCFCCLARCRRFREEQHFLGPLYAVKIAQEIFNPLQPVALSADFKSDFEDCLGCLRCYCPYGVPLDRLIKSIVAQAS